MFPTVKNLEAIAAFKSVGDLMEAAARSAVQTILPSMTVDG